MRIISGSAKGKRLDVAQQGTRPSMDRAREALFNILAAVTEGAVVLDLFAGSGALALEALSRGANRASCVESDRRACEAIRKNRAQTRLATAEVVQRDVFDFLKTASGQYDLIFADPPYEEPFEQSQLCRLIESEKLAALAHLESYLILESPSELVESSYGQWEVVDRRQYGTCFFTILQLIAQQQ